MTPLARALATCVALPALLSTARGAAAEAAAPGPHVRDTWIYQQTAEHDGKTLPAVRPEISTAWQNNMGDWAVEVRPADQPRPAEPWRELHRALGYLDAHGCRFDVLGTLTLQPPPCDAPMAVGSAWKIPTGNEKYREVKVVAEERITVPAGTYDTLRLESVDYGPALAADGQHVSVPNTRGTLWYAPAVRSLARAERTFLRYDGAVTGRVVEVLESFTPGEEPLNPAAASEIPMSRPDRLLPGGQCKPRYPLVPLLKHVQGTSHLRASLDAHGNVTGMTITEPSGPTHEHQLLDEAARDTFAKCAFLPARLPGGHGVASQLAFTYEWKLGPGR